ncbi:MAG: diguanylate cyclase [Desulfovibrio sp.]|nr:diguanylate cyclase [Desulfovibrio sp.]
MKIRIYSRLTKYLAIVGLSILAIAIALGITLIQQASSALMTSIQSRMLDVSKTAASMLNGDTLDKITSGNTETKEYQEAYTILKRFHDKIGLNYIYCVRDKGNKNFIFLIDPSEEDPGEYGSPVVTTEELFKASQGESAVNREPYEDNWGSFYSAYSPVFNSSGNVSAIVAVDFSSEWYEQQISDYINTVIYASVFSLFTIFALTIIITKISRSRFRNLFVSLSKINNEINQLLETIENLTYFKSTKNRITKLQSNLITKVYDAKDLMYEIASMQTAVQNEVNDVNTHAYVDGLTFLNNNAAYIRTIKNIDGQIHKGTSFCIAVFDICGLKAINDTYGHETGNMAILDAANLLKSIFRQDDLYRYDGGKFTGVFDSVSEDDMRVLLDELENKINLLNQAPNPSKLPLAISKGYAFYDEDADSDCNDVFRRAEIAMLKDKVGYYMKFCERGNWRKEDAAATETSPRDAVSSASAE